MIDTRKYLGTEIIVTEFKKRVILTQGDGEEVRMVVRGKKFYLTECCYGFAVSKNLDNALKDCRKLIYKNKGLKYR